MCECESVWVSEICLLHSQHGGRVSDNKHWWYGIRRIRFIDSLLLGILLQYSFFLRLSKIPNDWDIIFNGIFFMLPFSSLISVEDKSEADLLKEKKKKWRRIHSSGISSGGSFHLWIDSVETDEAKWKFSFAFGNFSKEFIPKRFFFACMNALDKSSHRTCAHVRQWNCRVSMEQLSLH